MPPRRMVPAWLASLLFHAALLVALSLSVGRSEPKGALPEPARTGGIALAARDEHGGAEYFSPEEPEQAEQARQLAESAAEQLLDDLAEAPLPVDPTEALPEALPAIGTGSAPTNSQPSVASGLAGAEAQQPAAGQLGAALAGKARLYVFGAEGVGQKFVYVFDRSASMALYEGAPLAAAKGELLASLEQLGPVQQFQIIFYNDRLAMFDTSGRLIFGTDDQKQRARQFVQGIPATGATHHEEALAAALQMNPDVIFFLTDADHPELSDAQLARLRRLNRSDATVHAIEFGHGAESASTRRNFLEKLARQNGGQHVYIDLMQLVRSAGRRAGG